MPGAPAENPLPPPDASRAALDFLHRLLCLPADASPPLDDLLSELAGAFGATAAGIVRRADGTLLVRCPPQEGQAGGEDERRLRTAFGPPGAEWELWVEDLRREAWTLGEKAALVLAGRVLDGVVEAGGDRPRWARQLERAARQQRFEDAARLARRLAHDYGNVLTGIVGFSELALGQQVPAHSSLARYLTEVHRGAEGGAALTHHLRLFAARQAAPRLPCSLAAVLAEEEVRQKAGVDLGIEFHTEAPADLPLLALDADMLKPALGAVLDNAREALCDPAAVAGVPRRIAVTGRVVTLAAGDCRDLYGDLRPGTHVEILVADSGPGLSPEARERLFAEPFFSSRSRRRGFGLASAYGILYAHRGGIEVRPGPARGVEVRMVVPVRVAPEPAVSQAMPVPPQAADRNPRLTPRGRGEKVLVVDDDAMMRGFVARALEQAGYRVSAVGSAAAALETYAAAAEDPFRVVLSDVLMPEVNGVELAHRLLNRHPGVRVLFMSGQGGSELLRQNFQDSSFEMLSKPFSPEGLLSAVRGALERKGGRARSRPAPPPPPEP